MFNEVLAFHRGKRSPLLHEKFFSAPARHQANGFQQLGWGRTEKCCRRRNHDGQQAGRDALWPTCLTCAFLILCLLLDEKVGFAKFVHQRPQLSLDVVVERLTEPVSIFTEPIDVGETLNDLCTANAELVCPCCQLRAEGL